MDEFLKGFSGLARFGTGRVRLVTEKLKAGTTSLKLAQGFLEGASSIRDSANSALETINTVGTPFVIFGDIPDATMELLGEVEEAINDFNLALEELQKEINDYLPF